MSDEKKKILVVDDEADVVDYLKALFTDNGFDVITGSTGKEAVQLARSEHPDLITLDIMMPDQSGVRAYKEIRQDEQTAGIPILLITGYDDPNFEKFISTRKTAPPPDGFFEKPIEREAVLNKVNELLK